MDTFYAVITMDRFSKTNMKESYDAKDLYKLYDLYKLFI